MTSHKSHQERCRDILKAARARFVQDGYARARLTDIARDAGLSKGGVYFHFRSKRELFDALLEADAERVLTGLGAVRAMKTSVADRLIFMARAGVKISELDPTVARFGIVMGEMALAHDDVRERLHGLHEAFVDGVRQLLDDGVRGGELRSDLDTTAGARVLVTLMDGVRASLAGDLYSAASMAEMVDVGVRLLLEGFRPR